MEQSILTPSQKKLISIIASEPKLAKFYLAGGTALSEYYLKHRFSEDLDFFSPDMPDTLFLQEFTQDIKKEFRADKVEFSKIHDRREFLFIIGTEELKVEFVWYQFKQLDKMIIRDGMRVDSFRDISANKLMAMIERFEPKDFVDLFFILQKNKLEDIRKDAQTKFGIEIEDIFLGGELAKARRIEALPRMITPLSIEELKAFFTKIAKELEPRVFGY